MSERYAWLKSLSRTNRLLLLDVLEDVRDAVQMNGPHTTIKLMPTIIKYRELLPGWGVGVTDAYMSGRQSAAGLLVRNGVLRHADIPRDWYGMGHETPLEIIADEAEVSAALRALKGTFPVYPGRARKSLLRRSASHIFTALLGAAIALALVSHEPPRLWAVVGTALLVFISVRGVPRVQRLPPVLVDAATVIGAIAGIGAILVMVFHLEMPRSGDKSTTTTTNTSHTQK